MPAADGAPRLAVRGSPVPGESLKGYVLRLAQANGHPDMRWLLNAAGLPSTFAWQRCDLRHLSGLSGADVGLLEAMACWPVPGRTNRVHFGTQAVPATALDLVHPRACAGCVEEDGIARQMWDLKVCVACTKHRCLLVDTCPHCGARLTWIRPGLTLCRCGHPWTDAPVVPASAAALDVAALLARALASIPGPDVLPAGRLHTLARVVLFITFFGSDHRSPNWRSSVMAKGGLAIDVTMVESAARLFADWPNSLYAWLDRNGRDADGQVGLQAEFGHVIPRLRAVFDEESFGFLYSAARQYFADHWSRGIVKRRSVFYVAPDSPQHISGASAAKALGVTSGRVARMIEDGTLNGDLRRMGGRRQILVEPRSLEAVRTSRDRSRSCDEAASLLGISSFQIERLRRSGIITNIPKGAGGYRYDESVLHALLGQLHTLAKPMANPAADMIALADLPAHKRVRLSSVIREVLEGHLSLWKEHSTSWRQPFRALYVRRDEVFGHTVHQSGDRCLSIREAAKALGVAVRMIPILVHVGCLQADVHHGRLRKCGIPWKAIIKFKENYCLSRDLRGRSGGSRKSLADSLKLYGVQPFIFSDSKRGISCVWKISDIAAYI